MEIAGVKFAFETNDVERELARLIYARQEVSEMSFPFREMLGVAWVCL